MTKISNLEDKLRKINKDVLDAQAKKDDQQIIAETNRLLGMSKKLLRIHVENKTSDDDIVTARPLTQKELSDLFSKMTTICPDFIVSPDAMVPLEKMDEFYDLVDDTIAMTAGLDADVLKAEVLPTLRKAIFKGIMIGSTYTAEELLELKKFREQQRRAESGSTL